MELVLTFYVVNHVIKKIYINLFMQYLHPTTKNIQILYLLFKKYDKCCCKFITNLMDILPLVTNTITLPSGLLVA